MPAKNSIKQFVENGYYHIYNRGVEKQPIFRDAQDYAVFLSYLKSYLELKDERALREVIANPVAPWKEKDTAIKLLRLNNFADTLTLLAYALMKNHFHFLVKQTMATTIDSFMNSLFTRYTMYINKKYKRVGPLFQGVYKAVLIHTNEQLLYVTRYIHRNSIAKRRRLDLASQGEALRSWSYSSYPDYLGERETSWVKTEDILSFFSASGFTSYKDFVEDNENEERQAFHIYQLGLYDDTK